MASKCPAIFAAAGKRPELQIALLRKRWRQPVVEHDDLDHRISRAGVLPRPKRQIPIWLGGSSEAAFGRAVKIGNGFLFGTWTQTEAIQTKTRVEAMLRERGRDVSSFGFESIQQTAAGTTNGWATSSPGARLQEATYPS